MNDAWGWWLFFVGLGVGVAVYWLLAGRMRRTEDDLAADERTAEADWISATIDQGGGEAPGELVAQILELHRRYLEGEGPFLTPDDEPEPGVSLGAGGGPRGDLAHVDGDRAGGETPDADLGQAG